MYCGYIINISTVEPISTGKKSRTNVLLLKMHLGDNIYVLLVVEVRM